MIPDSRTIPELINSTGQQLNTEVSSRKEDLLESSLGTINTTVGDFTTAKKPYSPKNACCPLYPNNGKLSSFSSTELLTSL